jgi:hypothetical protein
MLPQHIFPQHISLKKKLFQQFRLCRAMPRRMGRFFFAHGLPKKK